MYCGVSLAPVAALKPLWSTAPYLYIFPLCLIIRNMSYLLGKDLLSACTSMDSHHGHSDGPRSIPNSHGQVGIISLQREIHVHTCIYAIVRCKKKRKKSASVHSIHTLYTCNTFPLTGSSNLATECVLICTDVYTWKD